MYDLLRLREQHGGCFAIRLPDGQLIPWKALNVSEYLEYERLFQSGVYPRTCIEDEIFQKCVLDKTLVSEMGKLRAGVITAVVQAIMAHSGPQSGVSDLNELLDYSRALAGQAIHDLTTIVCTAFPAYTPDSLQELDFVTFMLRVAQAEKKLLQAGIMAKPLEFDQPGVQQKGKVKPPTAPRPEDLKGIWNQQQPQPVPPPVDQSFSSKTIITKSEMMEHQLAYTGHENIDRIVLEKEMIDNTAGHYGDYINQMKEGKSVQIKSVEQRVAEAKARAKENEAKYKVFLKKKQSEQEKLNELIEKRKAKRAAKRKKR